MRVGLIHAIAETVQALRLVAFAVLAVACTQSTAATPSPGALGTEVVSPAPSPSAAGPTGRPTLVGGSPVPHDSVVAIDPASGSIAAIVPVGGDPLLLDVAGGQVWTMDFADGSLSRVDPGERTRTVVSLPGGAVALHAAGDKVWVAANDHDLVRLDGTSGTLEQTLRLADETLFRLRDAGFFTVDGSTAWMTVPVVGTNKPQSLWRIDLATGETSERYPIGRDPLTPLVAEGAVWVPVLAENGLTRLDLASGTVTSVNVRDLPLWVASGAGSIWVALERSHTVSRLSPTGAPLAQIKVDSAPRGITFGGGSIWVATEGGLSEIDPDTNAVLRELRLVNVTRDVGGTSVAYLDGLVWVSIE
ncbi:MAG TPA: hypothetical protein VL749_07815 [Patescibacteria group bacterium]|nr:hypothetical protein [Patescibacteria group bacterium]